MSARRQYTEDEKATALAYCTACGDNESKTARDCKIPRATLQFWLRGGGVNQATAEDSAHKKEALADRLESLAHLLADAAPDKIDDAPLQSVMTSIGIAVDKMQLLRSKPTEIIEDASLSDAERAERINAILDKARQRRAEQAAEGADRADGLPPPA